MDIDSNDANIEIISEIINNSEQAVSIVFFFLLQRSAKVLYLRDV